MIKILLSSDIHLGSEIFPENFRLKTFKKLSYLAKSHDLFIIAGDLFHSKGINEKTLEFAANEFKSLRESGIEIVYMLGDNELNGNDLSLLSGLNVTKMFGEEADPEPYKYSKDGQELYIYNLSAKSDGDILKNGLIGIGEVIR